MKTIFLSLMLLLSMATSLLWQSNKTVLNDTDSAKYDILQLADGKFLVGGNFTNSTPFLDQNVALLNNNLTHNNTFDSQLVWDQVYHVRSVTRDPVTSNYYLAGQFDTYHTVPAKNIVRVTATGSRDNNFAAITSNGIIKAVAPQSDGKVIIGGTFTTLNGAFCNRIARLNADGSVDATFTSSYGAGFNGSVNSLVIQPDGKILVGGDFTAFLAIVGAPVTKYRIARLNTNGTLDVAFGGSNGFNFAVNTIALQDDNKILVGGRFTVFGNFGNASERGTNRIKIARLDISGALDLAFDPGTGFTGVSTDVEINSLSQYKSNKVIACGLFTAYAGISRNNISLLNIADASLATEFNAGVGPSGRIHDHVVENGTNIVVVGHFSWFNGSITNGIKRLSPIGAPLRMSNHAADQSEATLTIYPNPAKETINMMVPDRAIQHITVTSILGSAVLDKKLDGDREEYVLDISKYAKGVYVLSIKTVGGEILTKKFIKE